VVGGVAAVLEGAPITTLDLDILYDRRPENLEHLLAVLRSVDARYRDPAGRDIRPDVERLATLRLSLLLTELGPLDVLPEIGDGWAYDELLDPRPVGVGSRERRNRLPHPLQLLAPVEEAVHERRQSTIGALGARLPQEREGRLFELLENIRADSPAADEAGQEEELRGPQLGQLEGEPQEPFEHSPFPPKSVARHHLPVGSSTAAEPSSSEGPAGGSSSMVSKAA